MLRKSAISAVAVASSVALLVVGAPTASQAFTQKELTVCWTNQATNSPSLDLEIVADGPSYKTGSLDAGDCVSWDVRPGQYKMTVEDLDEFQDGYLAATCPAGRTKILKVYVSRMNDPYKAYNPAAFSNGEVTTNVKKNRSTTFNVQLLCELV